MCLVSNGARVKLPLLGRFTIATSKLVNRPGSLVGVTPFVCSAFTRGKLNLLTAISAKLYKTVFFRITAWHLARELAVKAQ